MPDDPIARAEVAVTWLLPGSEGSQVPVQRRFCHSCVPAGPVDDVVCVRCGDGPLLGGALTAGEEAATTVVHGRLSAAGWRLSGPVCPDCVGELTR